MGERGRLVRDDERTDSGTQCAGAAEVLEEALRF